MSSHPKPHFKKVKCIEYWYPEDISGHTPVPGWQVTPTKDINEADYHGVGLTVQEAWEDYIYWRDV